MSLLNGKAAEEFAVWVAYVHGYEMEMFKRKKTNIQLTLYADFFKWHEIGVDPNARSIGAANQTFNERNK